MNALTAPSLLVCIFAVSFYDHSKVAGAATVGAGVHFPNIIGRNVYFGIEAPQGLQEPLIKSSRYLKSESVAREILFENAGSLFIQEQLVGADQCKNLPIESATWKRTGQPSFASRHGAKALSYESVLGLS
jgi:hypothetical protein